MSASGRDEEEVEVEPVEPVELFDDYWFFQNLLRRKNRMVRSASDPYPTSYSMAEVFARIQSEEGSGSGSGSAGIEKKKIDLKRTPSLPVSIGNDLRRTPSLPEAKEVVPRSSRLTRQASLSYSNVLPPLHATTKTLSSIPAMPKNLSRRQSMENAVKNTKPPCYKAKNMMHRSLSVSLSKSAKSRSELEIEEVQGFKDLGFDFDKLEINPSVADILPGLQSKKPDDNDDGKVRRPYLSEAWHVQAPPPTPPPIMPDWIDAGSAGDMKKHLKYWARAVASNMRQEC